MGFLPLVFVAIGCGLAAAATCVSDGMVAVAGNPFDGLAGSGSVAADSGTQPASNTTTAKNAAYPLNVISTFFDGLGIHEPLSGSVKSEASLVNYLNRKSELGIDGMAIGWEYR